MANEYQPHKANSSRLEKARTSPHHLHVRRPMQQRSACYCEEPRRFAHNQTEAPTTDPSLEGPLYTAIACSRPLNPENPLAERRENAHPPRPKE